MCREKNKCAWRKGVGLIIYHFAVLRVTYGAVSKLLLLANAYEMFRLLCGFSSFKKNPSDFFVSKRTDCQHHSECMKALSLLRSPL